MSNFFLRFFSSVILLPFVIYSIYEKNFIFYILILFVFLITIYEINLLYKLNKSIYFFVIFLIIIFIFIIIDLRGSSIKDFYYLVWAMTIIWMSDIGGFLIGKLFKGPTFSSYSPKKTISGLIGSIIFSQISFLVIFIFLNINFNIMYFFIQLIVCISAVVGDLYFSFLKRKSKIKDFSNIIPGHGGLLDRIDGMIFGLIIFYCLKFNYVF